MHIHMRDWLTGGVWKGKGRLEELDAGADGRYRPAARVYGGHKLVEPAEERREGHRGHGRRRAG